MTARTLLVWVVMTVISLGCLTPALVMTATIGHDTPVPPVMTAEPTTETVMTAYVTAYEALHVRKEPGHDKSVDGYLYYGDPVVMTGKCSEDPDPLGWAEIVWQDGTAWVNADYLSENKCSEEK